MCPAMNKRLVSEGPDPLLCMTDLAIFLSQMPFDVPGSHCLHVKLTGSVTDFATGIFQMRSLFRADKTSGFAVSGCMTVIAAFYLFLC